MSEGRKRLSGAAYRKAALEKVEKEQEIVKKTPKIFHFFRKPETVGGTSSSTIGTEDSQQVKEFSENESGTIDFVNIKDIEVKTQEEKGHFSIDSKTECSPSSSYFSQDDSNKAEMEETKFDPALWPINEKTRNTVIECGINQDISKLDFSRSRRFVGGRNRFLTQNLFKTNLINGQEIKRSYLIYSESSGKLFCVPCQLFGGISKLAKEGFDDWKHANEQLQSHENSSDHKSCVLVMKRRMNKAGRIDSELLTQVDDEKDYWRNVLKRVVAVVRSLAAAGLPLRGHYARFGKTHNCGNFIMCIELISEFDPFLAAHISKHGNPGQGRTSYLSPTTYEEFLKIMGNRVTKEIINEIKKAKYFSLVLDSTPDISHVDQLAVIIRYVPENGNPIERFLCFLPNVGHKADELFSAVMDVLEKYEINIENCRGQAYDNASNMSGLYTGLQARIKEKVPTAMYAPCSAHSLNLVGEHSTSSCKESRDFFMNLNNLYNFFSASTKRWELLANFLNKKTNQSLKSLSKTRWSAREDACKALNEDWQEVAQALTAIANDEREKGTTRSEASGYLVWLQKLETAFLSILWGDLLGRFNVTSKKLQSPETDLTTVTLLYGSLSKYIKSIRSEFDFDVYENAALVKSELSEYEDETKRKKKRKLQPDENRESDTELTGRQKFRINTYNVIIDTLISQMEGRKSAYDEINSLFGFLTNSNKEKMHIQNLNENCKKLCSLYDKDLPPPDEFAKECLHFFGFLKELPEKERPKAMIRLYEVLNENDLQDVYPYINIALKMFLVIPASNCSAERSFSVLKRIKNYARSTMTELRLTNVAVLTIECDMTKNLDFDEVINAFVNTKSRRKLF